jgi:hypothetical protein
MIIYCEICENAYIDTTEIIENPVYRCTMCKEHIEKYESNRELTPENYNYKLVVDWCN